MKFYFVVFIYALTGGFIAIAYKWCFASGWSDNPISLGGFRALAVGVWYLTIALIFHERLLPRGRALWYLGIGSQIKMAYNVLFVWALVLVDVSVMSIMAACLLPAFYLVLTRIANPIHDRLSISRVIGCILGGIAAALMGFNDANDFGIINTEVFIIVSIICFGLALSTVMERKAIEHGATRMQSMLGATLYTAPGYFIIAILAGEKLGESLGTPMGKWTFFVCVVIGILHFGARRDTMGKSQVSGFFLIGLFPRVVTLCAAVLLLGEVLDTTSILGLIIMPFAMWVGRKRN